MRVAFSYAVVRVVPRVDREEFVNVGVVLHCPQRNFLGARMRLDRDRLLGLHPGTDLEAVERHLVIIEQICAGAAAAGPVAALPTSERFHWVAAPRSTVVQISAVHAGLTEDPAASLIQLCRSMVEPPEAQGTRHRPTS